ncbi:protein FAM185A isoform X3 [Zalophus californianus]|uniref:Protein FAM185A isoform X3 n=1 Tax=Zalophus californianus TaxID=9704 RepID=A0A6J2BIA2_ZALCA|nr:protein FAM185A isoform X3 [Zalophus californianus]
MFPPSSGWGFGCLRLNQLRVGAGGAARPWACRAGPARRYRSGGGERQPGSEPAVSPPGLAHQTLKEWALLVSPFGRLRARLPCHLAVRPLDPLTYPDGDRVLVAVRAAEGGARDLAGLQVKYDEALKEVAIVCDTIDPQASVEVNAPLKFDLNIKSSGSGCVKIQNIECENCKIETEQGTGILQSVKTVTIDKLQGSTVNITAEHGLLEAKYLYTESSFLSSAAGDITLGSVHGNITLQSKMGNITVDSSSGCLKASTHQGAIDVYVSQLGKVELKSHEGSILVKVASSLQAHLQLSGKEVDVNSEVHVQEMTEVHKDDGVIITGDVCTPMFTTAFLTVAKRKTVGCRYLEIVTYQMQHGPKRRTFKLTEPLNNEELEGKKKLP